MPLTHAACPVDGARLVLVSATNAAGDGIQRYECPNADWVGPWFTGGENGDIHNSQLPEVTRSALFVGRAPAGSGGGGGGPVTGTHTPADAYTNPSDALNSYSLLGLFNGTTWDRARGTIANGLLVDVSRVQGTVAVTQSTSPWVVSGTVTANQGGTWTVNAVQSGAWTTGRTWTLSSGTDSVTVAGTVAVTQSTSPWVVSGTVTANQGGAPWSVSQSGTWTVQAVQSGTWTVTANQGTSPWVVSGTVSVGNFPATQVVVGNQTPGDAVANPTDALDTRDFLEVFNGTTWDRVRSGAAQGSVLINNPTPANLQATVTQGTTPWVVTPSASAVQVVTVPGDVPSVTLALEQIVYELRRTNRLLEMIFGETPIFEHHDLESDG